MMLNVAAYHFAAIDDPNALADTLHESARTAGLRGTILLATEGINLFLAGPVSELRGFVDDLLSQPAFAAMRPKYSVSESAPFARLKVKVKNEIIRFDRDESMPLDHARAPALRPVDLARWIGQGHDDDGRRLVLLDTRNREEIVHGSFDGAMTLPIDRFTDLPAALAPQIDALADATVVSFCTGGIRCEKAALWMQQQGLPHVWQLDEGILGYFEQVGGYGYHGNCFVFDERVALDPSLKPIAADAGVQPKNQ